MKIFMSLISTVAGIVLLAAPVSAANAIASGKVKSVNADKKEFVLTESNGKDYTVKLGDNVVINRGGKDSTNELVAGDAINVCYEKGTFTWTAHYILVQEGTTKNLTLVHGSFKSYDPVKKDITLTDSESKDWTFPMANVKLEFNKKPMEAGDLKIGDHALAILDKTGDVASLKCLMISRK